MHTCLFAWTQIIRATALSGTSTPNAYHLPLFGNLTRVQHSEIDLHGHLEMDTTGGGGEGDHHQCDQIGRFIGLGHLFEAFGNS